MALKNDLQIGDVGAKSITKSLTLSEYTVAAVPSAATHKGRLIYVSNGNGGTACLAYSNGTNWKRVYDNANIS